MSFLLGHRKRGGQPLVKPKRLKKGDTVALVNPAGVTLQAQDVLDARNRIESLGLKVQLGLHLLDRRGYFAGKDLDRASDLNQQFSDSRIAGIIALRGGWGSARILGYLDYNLIRDNPKVLLGFSDITALHMAIHSLTGLVTFHGPLGSSNWTSFSKEYLGRVLMRGEKVTFSNHITGSGAEVGTSYGVRTIREGRSVGPILGGNLSVLCGIIGSNYLPNFENSILFLEDVGEDVYRIDRMLTALKLAGILGGISGFVFGQCTGCSESTKVGSLSLDQVLDDHILPLGIPAWRGAMIGHIDDQFTLPLGIRTEINASQGSIRLLETAVRS